MLLNKGNKLYLGIIDDNKVNAEMLYKTESINLVNKVNGIYNNSYIVTDNTILRINNLIFMMNTLNDIIDKLKINRDDIDYLLINKNNFVFRYSDKYYVYEEDSMLHNIDQDVHKVSFYSLYVNTEMLVVGDYYELIASKRIIGNNKIYVKPDSKILLTTNSALYTDCNKLIVHSSPIVVSSKIDTLIKEYIFESNIYNLYLYEYNAFERVIVETEENVFYINTINFYNLGSNNVVELQLPDGCTIYDCNRKKYVNIKSAMSLI